MIVKLLRLSRASVAPLLSVALLCSHLGCASNPAPVAQPSPVAGQALPADVSGIEPVPPLPQPPPPEPPPPPPPEPIPVLQQELDRLLDDAALEHAQWAVSIESAATGEELYRRNGAKLMMPASNMKVVTLATAAERLGWDFQYDTRLETTGAIESGRLQGDLVAVGSGDPSMDGRNGAASRVFDGWAAELLASGIHSISGRIIGDDNRFDDRGLGTGWSWEHLPFGFAAPVGALQYNDNSVDVTFRAGPRVGAPVVIEGSPPAIGPTLLNLLVTGEATSEVFFDFRRPVGGQTLEVRGSIPAGMPAFVRSAAVENPTRFFVNALRSMFIAKGITVVGEGFDIDDLPLTDPALQTGGLPRRVIARHSSPPLRDLAVVMMKTSQNLYADTLLKTLGSIDGIGSGETGRAAAAAVLTSWGIAPRDYVLADGSGLSRNNYITTDALVRILRHMQEPRHAQSFEGTLPIAGVDGTLAARLKGSRVEKNLRAKTGTINNVRALSGYLNTADGEKLAFSIIANHFNVPASVVDDVVDRMVEKLAGFTRRAATSPTPH